MGILNRFVNPFLIVEFKFQILANHFLIHLNKINNLLFKKMKEVITLI